MKTSKKGSIKPPAATKKTAGIRPRQAAARISRATSVEDDDLTYEMNQLFGKNRKLAPGERNLVSLFVGKNNMDFVGKVRPAPKGSRWVMLMAVDLSTFTVIEQAAVSSAQDDEWWRNYLQWEIARNFTFTPKEVAQAALADYLKGERRMSVLCQRYDTLYPYLDAAGQAETRAKVRKHLSKLKKAAT
jgi:hypothetical protein